MQGYNDSFSRFYDTLISNLDYSERTDFLIKQISRFKDKFSLVLDLACGTGSLTYCFAKKGYEMIGVDASEYMLMNAMDKCSGIEPAPLFLKQDLTQLNMYGTSDVALCCQDSLNHLGGKEDLFKAFDRLKFFVEPEGLFIFDMNTPYKHREVLGNNVFVYDTDEVYCVWQNFYNPEDSTVEINLDFFEDNGKNYDRSCENFKEFSCSDEEIVELLNKAQFTVLEIQGDYNGLPAKETDERHLFICKRNFYTI